MAHCWNGKPQHGRSSGKRTGSRQSRGETLCGTNAGQVGERHQHQRAVSVPASDAADFRVIPPKVFGEGLILFDLPSGATRLHHLLQGRAFRSEPQGLALRLGIRETAADEEEVSSILAPCDARGAPPPEAPAPGTFRALTHRETLPILLLKSEGFPFTHFHPAALSSRRADANRFITGQRQHRGLPMRFHKAWQVQVAALARLGHHPGEGDLRAPDAFDHAHGLFWLGWETNRGTSLPAA
jgi:hypothetical protein